MIPVDYLLILEGLILLCAGIFWGVGEIFGRGNPDDHLRNMMRAFWGQIIRPTAMHSIPGFEPSIADEPQAEAPVAESKKKKKGDAEAPRVVSMLNVKVVTGTGENRITGMDGNAVKIDVNVPLDGGEANKIVSDLLAKMLELPGYHIKLVRGHYDSRKLLQISHLSPDELDEKLAKLS